MGIQSRISQLGMAKQTAKGTPAAAAVFTIGLTGGNVFDFTYDQKELDTTWSTRGVEAYDRISMVGAVKADAVAMPNSIGFLLLAALGADAVTGSGPFVHTITPANALPWVTFFTLFGTEKFAMSDSKIDDLELSWTNTGALAVKITAMGETWNAASAWSVVGGERAQGNLLKGVGGTFTIDGVSSRVESGSIKISNKLVPIIAAYSTTPDDIFESQFTCTTSLVIVPDDLTNFRKYVTGTTTGTTVNALPIYGTLDLMFKIDATHSVEFTAGAVASMVQYPTSAPAGGPAKLTVAGNACVTAGGAVPCTFVVTNSTATY